MAKKWIAFCQAAIPIGRLGRLGHDEFTHYYYAQVIFGLGDDGYAKLFPQSRDTERVTWSKYRQVVFDNYVKTQQRDGSWSQGNSGVGPIYATAVALTVMQLDKRNVTIFEK